MQPLADCSYFDFDCRSRLEAVRPEPTAFIGRKLMAEIASPPYFNLMRAEACLVSQDGVGLFLICRPLLPPLNCIFLVFSKTDEADSPFLL